MTTEQAALDDPNMPPAPAEVETPVEVVADQVTEGAENTEAQQAVEGVEQTDSAPADGNDSPDGSSRVQERINKITADKYAEKRRADELERKLAEMQQAAQQTPTAEPTLEQFEYDDEKYQKALIDWKVQSSVQQLAQQQQQAAELQKAQEVRNQFMAREAEYQAKTPDYDQAISQLPQLPPEVLNVIERAENGPELAYYMAKRLDVADAIATSDPFTAAMRLGELSAKLQNKPAAQIKPSAAPEPVETIPSGGEASKSFEDMSMDELMRV